MGKVDSLNNESDLFIGGDAYRVSRLELRIKIKAMGKDAWKTLKKFDKLSDMAEYWSSLKSPHGPGAQPGAVVVRECVDNAAVLPPASKMPPVSGLPFTPDALITQYGKARVATLEVLRFGAMLCDLDDALSASVEKAPQGRRGDESLKGWLETHCTAINYGTAMGLKVLADNLRDYCKIPAKVPLCLAIPNAEGTPNLPEESPIPLPKLEKIQARVWDMIDGKSARQLRLGMCEAEGKLKGGAREREKLNEEQKRERQLAAAKAWWTGAVADMCDQVSCGKSHALLDQDTLNAVFTRINTVRDALKEAGAKEA